MITVEKLRAAVVEMIGASSFSISRQSMIAWQHVEDAFEKLLADEPRLLTDEKAHLRNRLAGQIKRAEDAEDTLGRLYKTSQLRELTVDEMLAKAAEIWGDYGELSNNFVERLKVFAHWIVKQPRPAMCWPTADEVREKLAELNGRYGTNLSKDRGEFIDWYNSYILPIADVTKPLERQIKTKDSIISELRGRVSRKNETIDRQREQTDLLESQLAAAKADKPLDWKNMAINERLEAVGCRPVSDLMLTPHDDVTFSIEPKTKPPCMTVEAMRKVVAKKQDSMGHPCNAKAIRDNKPKDDWDRGVSCAIRALAGHVADQTAEVTRLRQESSRCIQAAFVGNDTNQYESVPEMLCDDLRKQVKTLGQTIHKLETRASKRNRIIREHLEYFRKLKEESKPKAEWPKRIGYWISESGRLMCGTKEKPEPKPEWPKYVVTNGIKSIEELRRLDGPGKRAVQFNLDGTESEILQMKTECYFDKWGMVSFPRIPTAEAEAMIAEAKERAKPTERWYTTEGQLCLWVYRGDETSELWHKDGEHHTPAWHLESNSLHIPVTKAEAEAIMAGWKKGEGK